MPKKSFQVLLTPRCHLRLKVQAAMLGITLGDMINFMLEVQFPLHSIEADMNLSRGIKLQEAEE